MNPRPTTSISASFELHLVVPGGENLPVDALLRYDASDPYAVHVGFHTGGDDVVEWTFARQLLTDGVTRSIGEGDVQVWPAPETDIRRAGQLVCLSLSSPSGTALFEAPLGKVVEFLTQTYAAVPTGTESDFVDLDAELALLMWSGAGE
jgi:hypothetical protein